MTASHTVTMIAVGEVLVAWYIVKQGLFENTDLSLLDAVVLFLASAGIFAGVEVCCISTFSKLFSKFYPEQRTYFFIGGGAVIWVSISVIMDKLRLK
jgi:hypothetical protein